MQRYRGRFALTIFAVALGVALVVATRLMNAAVLASFVGVMDGLGGRATLTIAPGQDFTFGEDLVTAIAAVPGVKLAVPLVRSVAFPDDGSGELITVHGVDVTHEAEVRVYQPSGALDDAVDDPLVFLSRPDSIMLGREFAERRGLAVGSRLNLITPIGVKAFTVRGLLEPQGLAKTLGGRLAVMDLYAAERAFTADGEINRIDIVAAEGANVAALRMAIAALLPAGLTVEEPSLRKEIIRKTIAGFQAMLTAFALLAVVAGFVICYGRLGAIFEARTWEVGLLRAVGLRRSVVFGELLKESLLLGVIGTLAGMPLGVFLARRGLPLVATATSLNFRLPPIAAESVVDVGALGFGATVGILASILAAAVPALRLAGKQPVAALTMRGRDDVQSARRWAWVPAVSALALVVCIIGQRVLRGPGFGNLSTAFIVLLGCSLAGPLVRVGGRALSRAWVALFGAAGQLAAVHVAQQSRRAALTVATLGVGLGTVIMFGMLGWSFERALVSQVSARLTSDLVIVSSFNSAGWLPAPLNETIVEEVGSVPGVAMVAATRVADVTYHGSVATLNAYDGSCFRDRRMCDWVLAPDAITDGLELVARGDAVLVSPSFAEAFDAGPGRTITLDSPRGPQQFRVAGITRTQPDNAIVLSRDRFKRDWNDRMVAAIFVTAADGVERSTVQAALERRLGEKYRVRIQAVPLLIEQLASQARDAFSALYLMQAMALLLVSISIGDALAAGVLERTRELAMLRAVGVRGSRVFQMVLLEGAEIGLLGLGLAMMVGLALGVFWVKVQFQALLGWKVDLHFPSVFAMSAVGLTAVLCLAGSMFPALRAARIAVPVALRDE